MKRKTFITALSLYLTFSALSVLAYESDRLRPGFFEGKLSISPVPLVGQQAAMSLELTAVADDCTGATIQFRTPAGVFLLERHLFEDQHFTRGLPQQYSTEIDVLKAGNYALQATVYFELPNGQQRAEHFFVYLSVGKADSQVSDKAPFLTAAGASLKSAPTAMLAPTAILLSPTDSAADVRGYVTYYDDNLRQEIPIRKIKLELFENIGGIDRLIGSIYTNYEGFYSFEGVSTADLQGQTGRDIWLRVAFENDVVEIIDAADALYVSGSPIIYKATDGNVNSDFFWNNQNQYRGLGHMFNCIMDAHDFLQRRLGWRRDKITIKWPYGDWSKYYYEYYLPRGRIYRDYLYIPVASELNRTTMLHEYGHAVMTALYGYNAHALPQSLFDGTHSLHTVSDLGFAMKEGWAEFFEGLVDDSAYNVTSYSNANLPNVESNEWWTGDIEGVGSNTQGEIVEGAVASVLWDMTDTDQSYDGSPGVDDDDMDDMLEEIWDLMMNHNPGSILDFWDHWVEDGYGQTRSLYSIYTDHNIKVVPPWDVNADGIVDSLDLAVIGSYFGKNISSPVQPNPDVNRDGAVNILDLILWAGCVSIFDF